MNGRSSSLYRVSYDLRPAKQIERRMILDVLNELMKVGLPVSDYKYIGFGSVDFVDFIMLHKMMGMRNMISIEHDTGARRRVEFNRPFGNIELQFCEANEVLVQLGREVRYLIWLDYDFAINQTVAADIITACSQICEQSIVLVTVNIEHMGQQDVAQIFNYYESKVRDYFPIGTGAADFSPNRRAKTCAQILWKMVQEGLAGRAAAKALPLFNFVYRDGHRMLTIGFVLGGQTEEEMIGRCNFDEKPFVRQSVTDDPYDIKVPKITRKERIYLDAAMPATSGWKPEHFDLADADLETYREIYRYFPSYVELLLG